MFHSFFNKAIKLKVAWLAKSMIWFSFIMGCVVGLGLQNSEQKILFQWDIQLQKKNVKVQEMNNAGNKFLFIVFIFFKIQN